MPPTLNPIGTTAHTHTADSTSTTTLNHLVVTAYDKMVEMALRSEPMFRKFADKRPVDVTSPGSTVVMQLHNDIPRVDTALNELQDIASQAMENTNKVAITVEEYGNAVTTTEKLALESLSKVDPAVSDILAYNLRDSLDAMVWAVLTGDQKNFTDKTGTTSDVAPIGEDLTGNTSGSITSQAIRKAVAKLRGANVQPREGTFFVGFLHPDVSFDLRSEANEYGNDQWRAPHIYNDTATGAIWNGEVGVYEGVKWIETPRAESLTDTTGDGNGDSIYDVVILGKQALAEAVQYEPKTILSPDVDKLRRFRTVGWKAFLGWNIYRNEARYVINVTSSIDA